ncbi:Immunoglobulin I-set [Trinorchestia longiramus]|nr:Immunoglobulin I-set [Trinorchestia longiramus]
MVSTAAEKPESFLKPWKLPTHLLRLAEGREGRHMRTALRVVVNASRLERSRSHSVSYGGTSAELEYAEYSDDEVPFFLSRSQTFTVEVGQSIMIPCDVANQGDHKLVMSRIDASGKKHLVSAGGVKLVRTQRLKVERTKLSILNARRQDAGLYSCSFPTAEGVVLQHSLDVQYPPKMNSSNPSNQHVAKGNSVTLACQADGNPKPEIRWSYEGGVLPSGAMSEKGDSLTLEGVDRHVEGTYICTADNGIGEPAFAKMKVVVEYPPEIVTEKAIVRTGAGDRVELVCLVRGRPSPRVSWTRDGQSVDHATHATASDDAHRHTLIIRPVTEQDFGAYVCIAENSQGQKSAVVQMTGLPRQPRFTSAPAGGEVNSYTLTWETDSYYPIIAYRLVFRKAQANGSTESDEHWKDVYRQVDVETTTENTHHVMAHTLTGLDVATDYEAVVKVKNNYGWSSDSDRFSFATKKAMAVQQSTSRASSAAAFCCCASGVLPVIVLLTVMHRVFLC